MSLRGKLLAAGVGKPLEVFGKVANDMLGDSAAIDDFHMAAERLTNLLSNPEHAIAARLLACSVLNSVADKTGRVFTIDDSGSLQSAWNLKGTPERTMMDAVIVDAYYDDQD